MVPPRPPSHTTHRQQTRWRQALSHSAAPPFVLLSSSLPIPGPRRRPATATPSGASARCGTRRHAPAPTCCDDCDVRRMPTPVVVTVYDVRGCRAALVVGTDFPAIPPWEILPVGSAGAGTGYRFPPVPAPCQAEEETSSLSLPAFHSPAYRTSHFGAGGTEEDPR